MKIQDVRDDLSRRMAGYTHSMQPSNDEVSMALLICHIDELEEKIRNAANCLVCAAINDPMEVCTTTLDMLGDVTTKDVTSLHVHYWPEGTWCLAEDLDDYGYMSDDFTILELPDNTSSSEIEDIVHQRLGGDVTIEVIKAVPNDCKTCYYYNNQDRCPADCGGNQ